MKQSISSKLSNDMISFAQQRVKVLNQYRESLAVVNRFRDLESSLQSLSSHTLSAETIKILGSGQPPEEIRLTVAEIEQEVEKVKLMEAEINQLEKEIKNIQGKYIGFGMILFLAALSILLWHVGWFVQTLIGIIIMILMFGKSKR